MAPEITEKSDHVFCFHSPHARHTPAPSQTPPLMQIYRGDEPYLLRIVQKYIAFAKRIPFQKENHITTRSRMIIPIEGLFLGIFIFSEDILRKIIARRLALSIRYENRKKYFPRKVLVAFSACTRKFRLSLVQF